MAIVYARLGEKNKSIGALEQAYVERQLAMTEIAIEPALDPLRSEPRFRGIAPPSGLGKMKSVAEALRVSEFGWVVNILRHLDSS